MSGADIQATEHARKVLLALAVLVTAPAAMALSPPQGIVAFDIPGDDGSRLGLEWAQVQTDAGAVSYFVEAATSAEGPFREVLRFPATVNKRRRAGHLIGAFAAQHNADHTLVAVPTVAGTQLYCRVGVTAHGQSVRSEVVTGVSRANWFRVTRTNNLVLTLVLCGLVLTGIGMAQGCPSLYVRRIAGLEAIDEAVGRATEMGKPILYLTGTYDASEVSTLAAINILSHVARTVARYDSRLIVPCKWSIAMAVCQETIREAYVHAGRPDAYREEDVFYVAGEQFSYTAAVDGIMVRERPAANFLLGTYAAESLILAETGAATGAIQIAGTDSSFQIPFFVVCCDYCLIGEELYAASAYLSRDPRLLGTLRGQDLGKVVLGAALVLGSIGLTITALGGSAAFGWIHLLFAAT